MIGCFYCLCAALTEDNGEHLRGFLFSVVHAPEACVVQVKVGHGPQGDVCLPIGQVLYFTAHAVRRPVILDAALCVPPVPAVLLQLEVCAAARRMTDATVVLRVHWGQHRVLHRSGLGTFAPQASCEQAGLGRS